MFLSALAKPFLPATKPALVHVPTTTNVGYKLMEKMGWSSGTPLGIRGKGICSPIEVPFRHDKDYRGLGFEELQSEDEEVDKVSMKITNVGKYYGKAESDYGMVYVPTSSLRYVGNIAGLNIKDLIGIYITGVITKTEARNKWRINKVSYLLGSLHETSPYFVWSDPIIQ